LILSVLRFRKIKITLDILFYLAFIINLRRLVIKKTNVYGSNVFSYINFFYTYFEDRGKGIHKFLDKVQNLETYVVIDDHTFTDFDEEIRAHLILTDYSKGLTDEDAEKAIRLLNTNTGGE
jgi:hypothetical protein